MLVVFCEPCAGCTGTGARGKCAFHRAGSGKWKVFPHLRRVAPQARDPTPGAPPWPPRAHKTSTCRPSARRASGHVACSSIRRHARQLQYDVRDRGRHPGDAPAVPARGALLIPAARAGGDARPWRLALAAMSGALLALGAVQLPTIVRPARAATSSTTSTRRAFEERANGTVRADLCRPEPAASPVAASASPTPATTPPLPRARETARAPRTVRARTAPRPVALRPRLTILEAALRP